jgi:GT2 family glycosyltransferase/glycosyltransferase involved in cell wall biosynthesis
MVAQSTGPVPFDVFVFPIIDWRFRHQRPQQLAAQLAARGHRVFYFATTFVTSDGYRPQMETVGERIHLVQLPCSGTPPIIYEATLTDEQVESVTTGIEQLRLEQAINATVSLIDHPFWWSVVKGLSNNRAVYDCMDHHGGFSNTAAAMLDLEESLIDNADLVVTTSDRLAARVQPRARRSLVIRNATDYSHFAMPAGIPPMHERRRIVGYYGAIADWFDATLVAAAAKRLPDCDFVLIGSTFSSDLRALEGLPNVRLTGEIPYADLPAYAQVFDVCIIPFLVNELTLSTNPVKVYEYLSMGKPVVSVRLPELELLADHIRLADTTDAFCDELRAALAEQDPEAANRRRLFAKGETWANRANQLGEALAALFPPVSVIVLTYNGLEYTKACLQSLDRHSDYPAWELIVVDNGSSDGTQEYLRAYAETRSHVRLKLHTENRGFAAGNNEGARAVRGEYLVFLNNDTYVTAGWMGDMVRHFERRPDLGLLNPVTNNIGNEARIDISYTSMEEMVWAASSITRARRGRVFPLEVCAFFCVMIPKRVWEDIGELDERFGQGFFEDDDYARRARSQGYALACAEDVFVHHHLSASFDVLGEERKKELFTRNLQIFESKWGTWVPHRYRGPTGP